MNRASKGLSLTAHKGDGGLVTGMTLIPPLSDTPPFKYASLATDVRLHPAMADVQLESAVSAVVSVFHAAIENVKTLRNHAPRGVRNEHTMMEKWLQDTLVTAEGQISQRFSQYSTELGEAFTAGDGITLRLHTYG